MLENESFGGPVGFCVKVIRGWAACEELYEALIRRAVAERLGRTGTELDEHLETCERCSKRWSVLISELAVFEAEISVVS